MGFFWLFMCKHFLMPFSFFSKISLCLLQFDSRTAREDRTDSRVCVCVCVSCFMAVGGDDPIEGQLAWRAKLWGPSLTDECTRGGEKRREHGKKPTAKHATHRHRRTISQWMLLWKLMSVNAAAKSPVFSTFSCFTGWNVDRAGFFVFA